MNQEQLLAKRDELAQEYHLGELELYCTPMTSRRRAILAVPLGLALVFSAFGVYIVSHSLVQLFIFFFAMLALVTVGFLYLFRNRTSVYVYTRGLVCLRPSGGRVVHWEEIRKVWIQGDEDPKLFAELNDDTRIEFPVFRSRGSASYGALQKFIEEKMAPARRGRDQ